MLTNHLVALIVGFLLYTGAEASYSDVDIPFLSKLKFELRNFPKPTQCKLLVKGIRKKSGQIADRNEEILTRVRDLIRGMDSIAQPIFEEYISKCIEELRDSGLADGTYSKEGTYPAVEISNEYQGQKNMIFEDFFHNEGTRQKLDLEESVQEKGVKKDWVKEKRSIEKEKYEDIFDELESLKAKQLEKEAEMDSLRENLRFSETDRSEMKEEIGRLREQLNKSCETVKKRESDLFDKLEKVASSNEQCQAQVSDLTKANESVKFYLKVCLNEKENLTNELDISKSQCEHIQTELNGQLETARTRADRATRDYNGMQQERDNVVQELNNIKRRVGMCQSVYHNGCCRNGR